MKQETIKKILAYFEENEELFNQCIEELDSYNGFLGDNRYYDMEMINEFYNGIEPTEILTRAFYGRDNESWHTNGHGEKEYGAFNPNRNYFYYNGYGNFVSTDYKDYSAYLDENTVQEMSDYRNQIYSIDDDCDIAELFDELEQDEEENE